MQTGQIVYNPLQKGAAKSNLFYLWSCPMPPVHKL